MIYFYKSGWLDTKNIIVSSNTLYGYLQASDVNTYKANLLNFKNNKIEDGDIVCFGKDNITRDKLKDLNERVKFKRVTDESKANTLVIDDIWFNDKVKESKLAEYLFLPCNLKDRLHSNDSFVSVYNSEACIGEKEHITRYNNSQFKNTNPTIKSYYQIVNLWLSSNRDNKSTITIEEQRGMNLVISKLKQIADSLTTTKKIVLASSLQHQFNEDSIELNEETYETLKSMFASSDTENTLLALEILANAKIPEENRVLVTLLLYNNYYSITPLIKTNNINKFLKLYKYEYKLGREPMSHVMGLLMDKYYSPKFESFIKALIVDYINKHLLNDESSKHRISAIELS
jgi:hypothetical protein